MSIHPEGYFLLQLPLQIYSACNLYMELLLKCVIKNVKLEGMVCVFLESIYSCRPTKHGVLAAHTTLLWSKHLLSTHYIAIHHRGLHPKALHNY